MPHSPPYTPGDVPLDPERGLGVIDVDEVLALFVQGFRRFAGQRGFELRMTSFALTTNLFKAGSEVCVERATGKDLLDAFFAEGIGELHPAPGAVDGLRALSEVAQVVILTNAPEAARKLRAGWLTRHGMDYPLILNEGLKGPAVAILAGRVSGPVLFVDDLLPNLDSVASSAPAVARFQMVADPELRAMAPTSPERHRWVEDWEELAALARATVFAA